MGGTGILISQADCPEHLEPDFDRWYDTEHIPQRLALDGFAAAERYHAAMEGIQRHLVLYHLSDVDVLGSPAYQEVKQGKGYTHRTEQMLGALDNFTRFTGAQIADSHPEAGVRSVSSHVLLGLVTMPVERWRRMRSWHEQDRLLRAAGIPGWLRRRSYCLDAASPSLPNLAVLHDLSGLSAAHALQRLAAEGAVPFSLDWTGVYTRRADRPNAWS